MAPRQATARPRLLDSTLVTAHSVTLIGLTSNATYNFRVHSSDALGNEAVSANATFIIDTAAPSIPTGLTATAISSSQINLSWTASTDNVAVTGYQVLARRNCDRDGGDHLLQQHWPDRRNELCLHGEGSRRRRQRIGGVRLRERHDAHGRHDAALGDDHRADGICATFGYGHNQRQCVR